MLLTIGIPTFNRQVDLIKILNNLIKIVCKKCNNSIEILVANNNSSDETAKLLEDFKNTDNKINFRYINNEINVGFDGNIEILYKNAKGKFIWF